MELEIRNISKYYKDKKAVDQVSLTLTPGVWGLLGANGAGKTSLMRMIAGIVQPTSGEIFYDGLPITMLKGKYREIFGYLPQEFGFYPEFTVKSYLEYVASLKGLSRVESKKKIAELLERLTLSEVKNKKIVKLSGGMKRRVGIAQALLNDPKVLILDEPTSGLDPGERIRFRNLLSEFANDRIVLISTHIVSDVEYMATQNAIMKEGHIIETGSTEELICLVEGKVWSGVIPAQEIASYEKGMRIVNLRNEDYGMVSVRYLADGPQIPDRNLCRRSWRICICGYSHRRIVWKEMGKEEKWNAVFRIGNETDTDYKTHLDFTGGSASVFRDVGIYSGYL